MDAQNQPAQPIQRASSLEPAALDGWLREDLGRPLVVIGLTIPASVPATDRSMGMLGTPPAAFIASLEPYQEIWLRWLAAGMTLDQALARAATQEADVLLIWVAESPVSAPTATPNPAESAAEPLATLRALLSLADAHNVRDRCVLALVGPRGTQNVARRLGYDDGFGPDASAGTVATALAREALAREQLRSRGSSPPCFL